MKIIIGKRGNQPFPINDEYVSGQHATFTYNEKTGVMMLADHSRNGTWVKMGTQFRQISQCVVDETTEVRLGPYYVFRIEQLFKKVEVKKDPPLSPEKGPKTDPKKKMDIAYLRKVAENYEDTKLKLEQRQATINGLRTLSLMGTLAGGALGAAIPKIFELGDEWYNYAIGPVIAAIFLICLMLYCNNVSKEIIVRKKENEKNYKIRFCCPSCHVPFAGKLYENILAEEKCPKCKTVFYDSLTMSNT